MRIFINRIIYRVVILNTTNQQISTGHKKLLELTGRTSVLELKGCPGLLELTIHTNLLKLTKRTSLRA